MAFDFDCNLKQGFSFDVKDQYLVGHVTAMTIGTTVLKADIKVTLPTDLTNNTQVVGVMRYFVWEGSFADTIHLGFNVSTENSSTLQVMGQTTMKDTSVTFTFHIYKFDPVAKIYFLCATATSALNGLIWKNGGKLAFGMKDVNNDTVSSPLNSDFDIGIMPQEKAQVINFAVSNTDKYVKTWGITTTGT
jgi:hypothetical protein